MPDQTLQEQYGIKFATGFELVAQQQEALIWGSGFVRNNDLANGTKETWLGEYLTQPEFRETTGEIGGEHQSGVETLMDRRMTKRRFDNALIRPREIVEKLETMADPTGNYMTSLGYAWNRKLDSIIIEAATAPVTVNRTTPTQLAFPAGNYVPVNYVLSGAPVNSGLTPQKMNKLRRDYIKARVPITAKQGAGSPERLIMVMSARQLEDLEAYVAASPNDVWAKRFEDFLSDMSKPLYGFDVILSEDLREVSPGIREVLTYTTSAFVVGGGNYTHRIDELPKQKHAVQLACYADAAIVRRWDNRVRPVLVQE